MSRIASALAVLTSIGFIGCAVPALAQTQADATAQAKPVMVKILADQGQMPQLVKIMHSSRNNCFLQDLVPDDESSLIMVCGVATPTATIAP